MVKKYKIVLLTGAGFSAIVGLKTLKSIVETIQVPLESNNEIVSVVTNTWNVIKGQKGRNTTLEDLIAKLKRNIDVAQMIADDHVFREHLQPNIALINNGFFKWRWEQALSYCLRLILDNYGPQRIDADSKNFAFIDKALGLLAEKNDGILPVFTTNYDCLLNVLADKSESLNFYSHINNKDGKYEKKWFSVKDYAINQKSLSVYTYRLHGCIGWFSDSVSPYGVHEVLGVGDELEITDDCKLNQMAIKLTSDEKIGLKPAFSHAFDEFDDILMRCENLLVWGHSFKDLQVLKSIMVTIKNKRNKCPNIYYIDPYLTDKDVINNIQDTIRGEAGMRNNISILNRLDWEINDGYLRLYDLINETF